MNQTNRFQDENLLPSDFYQEVCVVCSSCSKKAMAKVNFETKTARLLCLHCGCNKETTTAIKYGTINTAANHYFQAELWLQAPFKNDIFWAYNNAAKSTLSTSFDPAKVAEAFRHYMAQEGSTFRKENIAMELERRMKSVKFRKDMDGYLATGQSYDIDKAHAEFIEVFLPHL